MVAGLPSWLSKCGRVHIMINVIVGFITSLLASDKMTSAAIDFIRDKSGANEMSAKDKADAMLQIMDKTRHQSSTRRFIAILTVVGVMLFSGMYLLVGIIEYFYLFFAVDTSSLSIAAESKNLAEIKTSSLKLLRNDIYIFMRDVLKDPFSIVFGFYFLSQSVGMFKK